ncbi:MAG: hypothetical protein ACR2QI_02395 [Woeseiaceae bacterium]
MFFVIDTSASNSSLYEERIWRHLWDMRDVMPVSVVLPTIVSSPCPLLAEENADAILSSTGIQVPHNSAWIPMQVDVSQFLNDNGDIRLSALEIALFNCVDQGDALHDSSHWPSAAVQYDSWLNRRLAVAVRGWGNLVSRRGADPRAFRTLSELENLADFIGKTLRRRSQALARERGHCPAVDVAGTRILNSTSEMQSRWQRAVDHTALRHRNLTTMSAWDVFPQGQPADLRYLDLLPLLRCANCLSFQRDVDIAHWNINEFRSFYERVSAILQCNLDAARIAKQV